MITSSPNVLTMRQIALTLFLFWLGTAFNLVIADIAPVESVSSLSRDAAPANPFELGLASPRDTLESFLSAMNDIKRGQTQRINQAVDTLDLAGVNLLVRKEKGRDLAWTLLEVLDRTKIIDLTLIPDDQDRAPYTLASYPEGKIVLSRQADGRWLFSKRTLENIPAILDGLADTKSLNLDSNNNKYLPWNIKLRQQLPDYLKKESFLLENWQWLGILLVIAVGVVADKISSVILKRTVRRTSKRAKAQAFQEISEDLLRPFGLMAMAMLWWVGLNLLGLPEAAMVILLVAVKILVGISGVWGAYRLVDLVGAYLLEHASHTESKIDDVLIPLISKTLKVFVTVIGVIFVASNLNLNVTSLLASVGLGGLAFALAAKDVVQNLFGSITVLLDRTFDVGDWIVVDNVEGSVEAMGLRSTRIRTFYNSLVVVPNVLFITANVDNMGKRRYRRLKCNVSLTYDTPPEKIEAFCEGLRELVRLHPYMRKDYYHIYLNTLASSSLDVLVYVFWETPDWGTELRERHRFLLDILRMGKAVGVSFAFPTQTLHLHQELDEDKPQDMAVNASIEQLIDQGKNAAKQIVEENTGLDQRPPPVTF